MSLYRSALCALALFVAVPVVGGSGAEAVTIKTPSGRIIVKSVGKRSASRVIVATGDTTAATAASIKSDAGSEDVTLVESDAWLHGGATIKAAFKNGSTIPLKLKLYRVDSSSLMSFSGTLGTDGTVTLTADDTKEADTACEVTSKLGCADTTSETSTTALDIEVLAAEVFGAAGSYELSLDLAGADTYEVAYAEITLTESTEVTTCDKSKVCTTTGSSTTTTAEVDWDAIGAVWEGDLTLDHEGVIDVKVKTADASGEVLENSKVALGVPWIDGGEGVNVLAVDGDPLTTVAYMRAYPSSTRLHVRSGSMMVVNSSGWTPTTAPISAKLELDNGETITIPVNSYQRGGRKDGAIIFADYDAKELRLIVTSGSTTLYDSSTVEVGEPSCSGGTCVVLVENEDGDYDLSVSEYGTDATKLADKLDLTITTYDKSGEKQSSEAATVEFEDDVTAVFANEVSFSEDPIGLDLSGQVSLLGAADSKGKQKTLSKGKFYGGFSRDGDGDLSLAGADKNAGESEGGSVVVAGDAMSFELTDTNGDGWVAAPPIVALYGDLIMGGMPIDFTR